MPSPNLLVPSLLILLAIPLIFRKVPPNLLYGFRTQKTMSNDTIWYAANWGAGWDLVFSGTAMLVLAALKPWVGVLDGMKPGLFLAVVQLPLLLVGVAHSYWRLRKL